MSDVPARAVILVVDDDPAIRTMYARALASVGAIEQAASGVDALRMLAVKRYDCILLDLHMPGIDGHGVLRALHEKQGLNSHTPRIVATADTSAQARAQAFGGAAMSFLPKPVSIALLLGLVNSAVKKSLGARAAEAALAEKKKGTSHG